MTAAKERVDNLISTIKDTDIRTMLGPCQHSSKYPKDCLTDGALELLARKIKRMEDERDSLRAEKADKGRGS